MSKPILELVDGPLDGKLISFRRRPAWVWVEATYGADGNLTKCACYLAKKPGRLLYVRVKGRKGYVYGGHSHALCGGCGALVERLDGHVAECSLCGSPLITR